MKKVLSFVLVLAMILGSVSMAFADSKTTTAVTKDYAFGWDSMAFSDAEENGITTYLKLLGVLDGYEDGTVKAANELTRAEAATLVVRAMGQDALGKVQSKTAFKDVPATHWASGYIALANQLGYVDGRGNNMFAPDEKLTVDEAIAMIMKVLGYDNEHLTGVWPMNYRLAANGYGMLTKVTAGTQNATRQDFFQLISNALDKKSVAWNKFYEKFEVLDGKTLEQTILAFRPATAKNKTLSKVTGNVNSEDLDCKVPAKYLGKNVTFVTYGSSVAGIYTINSKTVEGNFEDDEFKKFAGLTFADLDKNEALFIVNGGTFQWTSVPSGVTSKTALTAELLYNVDGVATTLASLSMWKADKTVVLDATKAALLVAGSTKSGVLAENVNFPLTAKNAAIDEAKFVIEGADSLADLKEDDVLEVYINPNTEVVSKIVVVRNVVTGNVTKKQTIGNVNYVTVNGQAYALVNTLNEGSIAFNDLGYASAYAFKLNGLGKVVDIQFADKAEKVTYDYKYAFVLDTYVVGNTASEGWANVTGISKVDYKIRLVDAGDKVAQELVVATKAAAASATNLAFEVEGDNTGNTGKLVKYAVKDNVVVTISAIVDDWDETISENVTLGTLGVYGVRYAADAKVVVFNTAKAETDAAYYAPSTVATVANKTFSAGDVVFYTTNATGRIDLLVLSGAGVKATTAKNLTGAAVIGTYYVSGAAYAQVLYNGVVEEYKVAAGAVVPELTNASGLVKVVLASGNFSYATDTDIEEYVCETTSSGLTYDAEKAVITVTGAAASDMDFAAGTKIDVADTFYVYAQNKDTGVLEVADFAAAVKAKIYNCVVFYDVDADSIVDTVVFLKAARE